MARGPENTFIAWVHRTLPTEVYRMKNHNTYNSGIADCWYSGNGGDLWVEYKYVKVPQRPTTRVDIGLTELQKNWLSKRFHEGRNVCVAVGCADGVVLMHTPLIWELSMYASTFSERVQPRRILLDHIREATLSCESSVS